MRVKFVPYLEEIHVVFDDVILYPLTYKAYLNLKLNLDVSPQEQDAIHSIMIDLGFRNAGEETPYKVIAFRFRWLIWLKVFVVCLMLFFKLWHLRRAAKKHLPEAALKQWLNKGGSK